MIDYLFNSNSETNVITAIGAYNPDGLGALNPTAAVGKWRPDICNVCVITDYTNPAAPTVVKNFSLWVGLPSTTLDSTLVGSVPFVMAADRAKAAASDPNYLLVSNWNAAQRAKRKISPVIAGAYYPFMNT